MDGQVVLVDIFDRALGTCEKLEAHRRGLLHRAFSVFLYHGDRLLLQQRAAHKYHSGGLWANTCCSHPRPGEAVAGAACRRLREETGIGCQIQEAFSFVYRHVFPDGLIEYELDHVLIGQYGGSFAPDPEEAAVMTYVPSDELARLLLEQPQRFAPWFVIAAPQVLRLLRQPG